ncbi:MAG TPA: Sua5/YciO/YrdC/YwlC family protein, partial [Anaerolineales bacterium]|nr:Sua5/YciO/YrdC/YwlC family protein [Anaerolineales bacterium]
RLASEVFADLAGRVDLVVDGGRTPGGQPSTVVDCTGGEPVLVREGPISLRQVRLVWASRP